MSDFVLYNKCHQSKYKFMHVSSFHLMFIYTLAMNILNLIFSIYFFSLSKNKIM